jgi:CBS domain-containing protein
MNTVATILSRKGGSPISVTPDTTVVQALQIMADKNIGSVVIMDSGKYLGLMTERDYSRKVILNGKSSTETKVSEIMSADLPPVKTADSIEYCMELMTTRTIRYLPVFDNETLIGIVSMSDVVKQMILTQKETIDHLEHYIHSNG